jgi:hypothetical protein
VLSADIPPSRHTPGQGKARKTRTMKCAVMDRRYRANRSWWDLASIRVVLRPPSEASHAICSQRSEPLKRGH